jgi:hypothetical protein
MSGNPHMFLLTRALRSRTALNKSSQTMMMAVRGGGGHFHKPDPKLGRLYEHTRLVHLEDVNTVLYHDFSPEYHMHLHSIQIQNTKQGCALIFLYFLFVIAPCWIFAQYLHRIAGSQLTPSLRPGKDHAHMGGRLIAHMKDNNYENKQDALGRRTAMFYKNYCRQVLDYEFKPTTVKAIEQHGFKF